LFLQKAEGGCEKFVRAARGRVLAQFWSKFADRFLDFALTPEARIVFKAITLFAPGD
jgi:hypothetical protein